MEPTAAFAQLQLNVVDRTQWRYEVIRPLVLFAARTVQQRAHETATHPDTVRTLRRRFRQRGMLGLLPANVEVVIRPRVGGISEAVHREIDRLKTLYDGFHYRELPRILSCTFGTPFDDRMVKKLWQQSAASCQEHLGLWDYHTHPDRYQARLEVIKLYYRGWDKVSISRFLHVSRPTVDAWIRRFEAEHFAGLVDKSRAPKAPVRKIWLPLMVQVYHLQKAHPDAGAFRIWSLLARSDVQTSSRFPLRLCGMTPTVPCTPSKVHTWPRPPLPQWGVKLTHLNRSSRRHLPRTMMPKSLTYTTRISAMILKIFHLSRAPTGG